MIVYLNIEIISYELMPRFDFNENNHFVETDPAIFMDLKYSGDSEIPPRIGYYIQKFTGFECSVTVL